MRWFRPSGARYTTGIRPYPCTRTQSENYARSPHSGHGQTHWPECRMLGTGGTPPRPGRGSDRRPGTPRATARATSQGPDAPPRTGLCAPGVGAGRRQRGSNHAASGRASTPANPTSALRIGLNRTPRSPVPASGRGARLMLATLAHVDSHTRAKQFSVAPSSSIRRPRGCIRPGSQKQFVCPAATSSRTIWPPEGPAGIRDAVRSGPGARPGKRPRRNLSPTLWALCHRPAEVAGDRLRHPGVE